MKRISLWLVLLALTPSIGKAWGYSSCSSGVRYTPYAFTYRHSGLVSCDVDYTPYAFTYRNSGLVPGYGTHSRAYGGYGYSVGIAPAGRSFRAAFRPPRPAPRHTKDVIELQRQQDGRDVIRDRLLANGVESAGIDRVLMIDNQLVSVDFVMKDRNLLIKYWNPEAIESLIAQGNPKLKIYENYRGNWAKVADQHEQNGGRIYTIEASDAQTIVAALDACPSLEAESSPETEVVLYAKN